MAAIWHVLTNTSGFRAGEDIKGKSGTDSALSLSGYRCPESDIVMPRLLFLSFYRCLAECLNQYYQRSFYLQAQDFIGFNRWYGV